MRASALLTSVTLVLASWIPLAAVPVAANEPPSAPTFSGSTLVRLGGFVNYGLCATDPEGDDMSFHVDYGDGTTADSPVIVTSGTQFTACTWLVKQWNTLGTFAATATATDTNANTSAPTGKTVEVYQPVVTSIAETAAPTSIRPRQTSSLGCIVYDQHGAYLEEDVTFTLISGTGSVVKTGLRSATYTAGNKPTSAVIRACVTGSPAICDEVTVTVSNH